MTRQPMTHLCRSVVLAAMAATWLAAPPAWSQKSAEKTDENRKAFRESVLAIRGQIDTTMKALSAIVEGKDDKARKSALKEYSKEIKAMDKQIQKTRDYAQKMKERGQAYFKEWEKSMKDVSNPTLQASAKERRDVLQAQYQKIETSMAEAKQNSGSFWKDLQDLEKYFMNDLSDSAVASSSDLVKMSMDSGKQIQGYIDEVVKAVDQVGTVVESPEGMESQGEARPEEAHPTEEAPQEANPPEENPPEEKPPVRGSSFR